MDVTWQDIGFVSQHTLFQGTLRHDGLSITGRSGTKPLLYLRHLSNCNKGDADELEDSPSNRVPKRD